MVTDNMPINEEEVKELKDKINEHSSKICDLEEDVDGLKSDVTDIKDNQIRMEEQFKFIAQNQQDFKDLLVQNMNALHQNMNTNNQLVTNILTSKTQKEIAENTNNTNLQITKDNNRVGLYGKLLLVVAAFFGGSKASDIWIAIKEIFK